MLKFFIPLICIFSFSFSKLQAFDFVSSFKNAKRGDYLILNVNKTYTCLSIFENSKDRLIFEEITYLQSKLNAKEAKKHFETISNPASHTLIEIDYKNKKCVVCFDLIQRAFMDPKTIDPLLNYLFSMDFNVIKKEDRRKIGVLDLQSSLDNRPIWNPNFHFNGALIKGHHCDGFRAIIPNDVKLIGGKHLDIYLDSQLKEFCFPVWFQISDDAQAFKIIALDMGHDFQSRIKKLPRPLPYFRTPINYKDGIVQFEIETTYPIESHRFFYYEVTSTALNQAKIISVHNIQSNFYDVKLEISPSELKEYGFYTTTDCEKDLVIESLQNLKIQIR